ncbi:RluA family pseudouridine synthase [Desulfuromonas carbonis]|uniref:RluA family pseudouridine synthase n=1 Tax=Desulfuromonas sp. DDH964 TaxID=1823759 RepID=UPI00078DFB30|nr:RluA family pseudouridine synthase [Desulfuromonas sp. DDH964]AMV72457.1 23S rRNA synthase [Desulfuromonas sp. DDH964]
MTSPNGSRRWQLVVPQQGRGERLDHFLAAAIATCSRKAIKRALDGGRLFLDGRVERRAGRLLAGGESILLTLDAPAAPLPAVMPEILFRDGDLLAVNKPPGLPVHATVAGGPNALDLVRNLLAGETTDPVLLHRLDADTSGVLLFALNAAANRALASDFAARRVAKRYLALVGGAPPARFTVTNYLRPGVRGRTVAVASGGQSAHTEFKTLGQGSGFALVEASPRTGRTHQIRVHLADLGFPLLGDLLYGGPPALALGADDLLTAPRHLLHAHRLEFIHPSEKRTLQISAPLPQDFKPFLEKLQKRPN